MQYVDYQTPPPAAPPLRGGRAKRSRAKPRKELNHERQNLSLTCHYETCIGWNCVKGRLSGIHATGAPKNKPTRLHPTQPELVVVLVHGVASVEAGCDVGVNACVVWLAAAAPGIVTEIFGIHYHKKSPSINFIFYHAMTHQHTLLQEREIPIPLEYPCFHFSGNTGRGSSSANSLFFQKFPGLASIT